MAENEPEQEAENVEEQAPDTTAPESTTILENPGAEQETAAPADWPEDWRGKLAAGDEKMAKHLERFRSPQDVYKSWRALTQKIDSGEVKQQLAEDATEEDIAAYRKANGIPEAADGYLEKLPDGLVVGEDDKPMVDSFLQAAHARNAEPALVHDMLNWYYETQEKAVAAEVENDKAYREKAVEDLRAEWGAEYRSNINAMKAFLDATPEAEEGVNVGSLLMGARLSDGTLFADNPAALKWLAGLANEANPAGFVAPGKGGSQVESVEAEIAAINERMVKDRAGYMKDTKAQERLRQLYDAQERLTARAS